MKGGEAVNDPPQEPLKRYPILITNHARQRWIERVADPKKYRHLTWCREGGTCGICIQLIHELRDILRAYRQSLDRTISGRALAAIERGEKVEDPLFIEAIKKKWPEDVDAQEHYIDRNGLNTIIFAIKREPDGRPVVVTVLTFDMLDGIVLMVNQGDQNAMKRVFETWKRQAKFG
jgi:hypothetical protein